MNANRICVGQKIGRLSIIGEAGKSGGNQRLLSVVCDCGNLVTMLETNIKRNIKGEKSCGCAKTKHGLWKTGAYNSWTGMMKRCYSKNNNRYESYGAKGIFVCERWHDFVNFYADMGDRPQGKTIDRIDNKKGYFFENCRWATSSEQAINRKSTRFFTINEETMSLKEWCDKINIGYEKVWARINVLGWNIEKALGLK